MSWCVLYVLLSDFRRPLGLRSERSSENAYFDIVFDVFQRFL
ncbi:hypothetical protein [Neisseria sicca]